MTFTVVARPQGGSRGSSHIDEATLKALIETVNNGQALEISSVGIHLINWQSTVRNRIRKVDSDLVLKYRQNKEKKTLTVWVENKDASNSGAEFDEPNAE